MRCNSVEQAASGRAVGWLQLTTALKHGSQFPAAQKDWLGREPTVPFDPGTNRGGIGGSDEASLCSGGTTALGLLRRLYQEIRNSTALSYDLFR